MFTHDFHSACHSRLLAWKHVRLEGSFTSTLLPLWLMLDRIVVFWIIFVILYHVLIFGRNARHRWDKLVPSGLFSNLCLHFFFVSITRMGGHVWLNSFILSAARRSLRFASSWNDIFLDISRVHRIIVTRSVVHDLLLLYVDTFTDSLVHSERLIVLLETTVLASKVYISVSYSLTWKQSFKMFVAALHIDKVFSEWVHPRRIRARTRIERNVTEIVCVIWQPKCSRIKSWFFHLCLLNNRITENVISASGHCASCI